MKKVLLALFLLLPVVGHCQFVDNFSTLNNWIVSDWSAPGGGTFVPSNARATTAGLMLTLTQPANIGGEVQCRKAFGYGTYTWVVETTPVVSGEVVGLFSFINNSETEIDFEISGDQPTTIYVTNYAGVLNTVYSAVSLPATVFHTYRYIWQAGSIRYYLDGKLIATHTVDIPSAAAYPMINLWGTDSVDWGGLETPGTTYLKVSSFSYSPVAL